MKRESETGGGEQLEMGSMSPTEEDSGDSQEEEVEQETDDYFQDPTGISKHKLLIHPLGK